MALTPGASLGAYEIIGLLGAGGMGEVYRAHDRRLGREVAIKILAREFTNDPERLRRFEREARVLAALNHPHIGAIYGLEDGVDQDGTLVHALVLELIDGETLAQRLARGPLPLTEAVKVMRQIADALEIAHEKGIVHRDLKPANVKITNDGAVKVLDFGLAKGGEDLPAADLTRSPTLTDGCTFEGTILGTAAYMSPEQARGKAVDRRTDIWAFGCVLYESLTGRQAFAGETVSDVIAAILGRELDWPALPAETPTSIRRLLLRCLAKDLSQRLRDIGDARLELDEAFSDPGTGPTSIHPSTAPAAARNILGWSLGALALMLLAGSAGWLLRATTASSRENPLAGARLTRLTDFGGTVRDPVVSPDGRFVAFLSDRSGVFDVWLTQVGSGTFSNLTNSKEPTLDSSLRTIGFASDGSQLWIHDNDRKGPLRLMSLFGGPARIFLNKSPATMPPMNATWSPDSRRIVYHTADAGDPMFVADSTGANARQIFANADPGLHNHFPIWSPDGRWIYFVRGNPGAGVMDLWRIRDSGDEPERLTHHDEHVADPTFAGADTLMYVARDQNGSGPWLWALDVNRKQTHRVSFGLEQYRAVSASADGQRLVAATANPIERLWSVPVLDRIAEEADVSPYALPTVKAWAPRFGGGSLFYLSSRGAGDGLWRHQDGEVREIWRGVDGALLMPAAVSADGSRVAFGLRRNGVLRLHVLSADGGDLQSIADGIAALGGLSWSPDGKWIVTAGQDAEGDGLFKIPVDGGAPIRLVKGIVLNPVWSPDGTLIVYAGAQVGLHAPLLAVRPDGTSVEVPPIELRRDGERVRFAPDGKSLIYMQGQLGAQDFWIMDLTTKKTRRLTRLSDLSIMRTFDITPDGKQIVFDRQRENSEVVLIDLPSRSP